jgi:hypothetical protein
MNQKKDGLPRATAANRTSNTTGKQQQPQKPSRVQPKAVAAVQLKKAPVAPPVYRPQLAASMGRPKGAVAAQSRNPPVAQPMRTQPGLKDQPAANAGARQAPPGATLIQRKSATVSRPSSALKQGGVIQRICGKCGSAYHSKKSCAATAEEQAAYLLSRMDHGNHGRDRPSRHVAASAARSAAEVAATVARRQGGS